jgi:hypothetical protein
MRVLRLVCLLALGFAGGMAFAQSDQRREDTAALPSKSAEKSAADQQTIKERVAYWLKTCLADWDRTTHMTHREWRVTCERVATERGKFLLQNPTLDTLGSEKVQKR